MKELRQITVIGLGLLGGSVTLAVSRCFPQVKTVGYTHRAVTRRKARQLAVAAHITDDINKSVCKADLVILATPIYTFEQIFSVIGKSLPSGCIITDIGSTKVLPHRWAAAKLPKTVHYLGSHPIAGLEQRGLDFARDDLFDGAVCILTTTKKTNRRSVGILKKFWSALGCSVKIMRPAQHDRIFADISHLPHIIAAALVNANDIETLKFAGKGFIDTSRIASGPANIWADILLANAKNCTRDIDKIASELQKMQKAVQNSDKKQVEKILERARDKRAAMIKYKLKNRELES